MLKVSEGLGCGIVINDTLYRGSHGAAGEVGHISADLRDPTVCACGNRGCLDVTIGTSDALVRMRDHIAVRDRDLLPAESVLDQRDELSIALIGQATVDGDLLAVTLLKEIGTRLGFMLAGIISFFNPSSVVISGATIPGHGVLLSAIRRTIYEHAFPGSTRILQIVESGIAEEGVVIGATVLASDGFLGTAGRVAFSTAAREVAELPEVVDA